MKTATQEPCRASVRDLRNHFAEVARYIEDGKQGTLTRNSAAFATVAPARSEKPGKPDWAARFKLRPPIVANRKLIPEETPSFYDEMKGEL